MLIIISQAAMIFLCLSLLCLMQLTISLPIRRGLLAAPLSSSSSTSSPPLTTSSLHLPVYIEMTDAFNVMFYANYPVIMERAISNFAVASSTGSSSYRLSSIKAIKYKRPAVLGDELTIIATRGKIENSFNAAIKLSNGDELASITRATVIPSSTPLTSPLPSLVQLIPDIKTYTSRYQIFQDELSSSDNHVFISTRTIFNLFERGRTDVLGGPTVLQSMLKGQSQHVYVARVSDYEFLRDLPSDFMKSNSFLTVTTQILQRGESMADFLQHISYGEILIAKADILTVCVDAITGTTMPYPKSINCLF